MLSDIFSNHLLMNALLAWATAQLLKFFIYLAVNRTIDWKRLTGDGGMPSGHSATVTALAVTSGLEYGYDSPVFAVCVILAVIVMHETPWASVGRRDAMPRPSMSCWKCLTARRRRR